MRSLPIVVVDEGLQGVRPGGLALPGPHVLPLTGQRLVHALDLAVLPGAVRPRVLVPDAPGAEELVEEAAVVRGAVVGHDALDRDAHPLEEAEAPAHERHAGLLPLVREQLGVGGAAPVVDGHVQAGRARRGVPVVELGGAAGPPAPSVRYPRDLLHVDVQQLAGPLPLVAHAGHGAAPPGLAGHAVHVGEPRQARPRDDPGAGSGRHARDRREGVRREQQRRARLHDPGLVLRGGEPAEPRRPAGTVRQRLAPPRPRDPLAGGLPAHAHLPGRLADRLAGLDALDQPLTAPRREACVRML